jgi:hypothetical protein
MMSDIAVKGRSLDMPAGSTPPEWFMFLAPENTGVPEVDGEAKEITLRASEGTAAILNADLQRRLKAGEKPHFSFDHSSTGPASAWPQEFQWRGGDKPGVYVRAAWTPDGAKAVTAPGGQLPSYQFFSPSVMASPTTGAVTSLHYDLEVGSVTNRPAFLQIAAVNGSAAKPVSAPADPNQDKHRMKLQEIADAAIRACLITSEEAAGNPGALIDQRITAFRSEASVRATQATELTAVKAELKKLKEEMADDAITLAVKAGRIAPEDSATKEFWKGCIVTQGSAAVKAMNALPDKLPKDTKTGAHGTKGQEINDGEESAAVKARNAQVSARAVEIQSKEGGSFSDAHARASRLIPMPQ